MNAMRVLVAGFLMTAAAMAQQGGGTTSTGSRPQLPAPDLPDASMGSGDRPPIFDARMESQRAKMRNEDRQKRLVEDTQKLLTLANQLKEEVSKSNKDTLSITVIKKAEEIEKLAKSVKERMKG